MPTVKEKNSLARTSDDYYIPARPKNRPTRTGDGSGRGPQNVLRSKNFGEGEEPAGPVRGYVKLSQATKAFSYDFRGKTVLDIGSSTGGFTKLALDKGAKKVIAVEKGTNQMMSPLRHDSRIVLYEKTDIFDVKSTMPTTPHSTKQTDNTETITLKTIPDVILADVSFISLTKILQHAKRFLSDQNTAFLVMLKPQFEARPDQLHHGVVKNEKIRREIIKDYESWLKTHGFVILKKHDNNLKGKTGNQERFYLLKKAKPTKNHAKKLAISKT